MFLLLENHFSQFLYQIAKLRSCQLRDIRRRGQNLHASLSRAYRYAVEYEGGLVDEGRKFLFHADWGTAAADIAGERFKFFER